MKSRFVDFLFAYRKTSLFVSLSLTLSALFFVYPLNLDFGPEAWFDKNDPNIINQKFLEETFGNDAALIVLVKLKDDVQGDLFTREHLEFLDLLTESIWMVDDVIRVDSLVNYHWSWGQEDELITEPFVDYDLINDKHYLRELRQRALTHNVVSNAYLSSDARSALIFAELSSRPDDSHDNVKMLASAQEILSQFKDSDYQFYFQGQPYLNARFQIVSFQDISRTAPILLLLMMIYLFWNFRSVIGVLIPMSIIFSTIICTVGLNGYLGLTVNSLTFVLPSILMAIAVADSVHLLTTFYQRLDVHQDWDRALKESVDKNLAPIFLTSISTAAGFFSLTISEITPVANLGLMAGIGTLLAMVHSFILFAPLLSLMGEAKRGEITDRKFTNAGLPKVLVKKYIDWLETHLKKVVLSFLVISGAVFFIALQNDMNSNPYHFFRAHDPVRVSNDYILQKYRGVTGPEIIIQTSQVEGALDPSFLKNVVDFKNWLESLDQVNHVMAITDILKEMNQALHGGNPQEFRIHPEREVIAQEIFLYNLALPPGMGLNNRIDYDYQKIRMSVMWSLQDSKESLEMVDLIVEKAEQLGLDIIVTGKGILFQRMNDAIVMTFFSSMSLALFVIFVMMVVIFRSLSIALMGLIPSFIPVVFGAALLKFMNIPIDIGSAIVASVTLGVAVDDTIHFISHYARLYKRKVSIEHLKAILVEIISTTGVALMITTLILVSCFGLFIFAQIRPNMIFGVLSAFVISLALLFDLFILPAFILLKHRLTDKKVSRPDI